MTLRAVCIAGALATGLTCGAEPGPPEVTLAITGQALIKLDPRLVAETPFATVQPIVASADVAFTNFEMAVNGEDNPCGVPADYVTITGSPDIPRPLRPGNTDAPHAVSPVVMEYLAGMGFDLMSLANNHAWDLGECGIRETIAAAREHGVAIAGTGTTMEAALAPAYLEAGENHVCTGGVDHESRRTRTAAGQRERGLAGPPGGLGPNPRSGQGGGRECRLRHLLSAPAAGHAGDFEEVQVRESRTRMVTIPWPIFDAWQEGFAEAIIDAGASLYLGGGHRGFDGVEWYQGARLSVSSADSPITRCATPGGYPGEFAFWGLIGLLTVAGDQVTGMEFVPPGS